MSFVLPFFVQKIEVVVQLEHQFHSQKSESPSCEVLQSEFFCASFRRDIQSRLRAKRGIHFLELQFHPWTETG